MTVKPDLTVAVGEDTIAREAPRRTLDTATKGRKDERIYLRADKAVSLWRPDGGDEHCLRNAGYLKVALVGLDGRS